MNAILAGNWEQYLDYCRLNNACPNNTNFKHIYDVDSMTGLEFDDYVVVGTFWQRNDCDKIFSYLMANVVRHKNHLRIYGTRV